MFQPLPCNLENVRDIAGCLVLYLLSQVVRPDPRARLGIVWGLFCASIIILFGVNPSRSQAFPRRRTETSAVIGLPRSRFLTQRATSSSTKSTSYLAWVCKAAGRHG